MNKILLIDGHSILNRAFYGVPPLTNFEGLHTNAVYGFLAILFNIIDDIKPEYIAVAFDLKGKLKRKELFEGYKANRHGMPDELAEQMPVIKEVLRAMNIDKIEKEGYEGDDILGTLAKYGEKQGLEVTILSGDRDTFQLASKNITIRIPRTKMGKTETEDYDESKIEEEYGIKPVQLIQVKGLMGDASDNIPGVPGVGEKTALKLIKEYQNIDKLYEELERGNTTIKGALKEKLTNNKESAILSRTLGTILLDAPLDVEVKDLAVKDWNKEAVTNKFKELRFNRFIERFDLNGLGTAKVNKKIDDLFKIEEADIKKILEVAKESKELIYYFEKEKMQTNGLIINESIKSISIYDRKANTVYYSKNIDVTTLKNLFEDSQVEKASYKV